LTDTTPTARAAGLAAALPKIRHLAGKTVVVKHGGSTMASGSALTQDLLLLQQLGVRVVVVHGGGPEITAMLDSLQVPIQWVEGLRVTDDAVLDVATMVLGARVNTRLVASLNGQGGRAIGLTGVDGNLLVCTKAKLSQDLGFVGTVVGVNTGLLNRLLDDGYMPVIAPIGVDRDGQTYNVNADAAAGAVAGALGAESLALLTDVPGIYCQDADGSKTIVERISGPDVHAMIADGQISGGMVPKVKGCLTALAAGVRQVQILDGRREHPLIEAWLTDAGGGTIVQQENADDR
jgi:acetylglutamate kinase